MFAPMNEMIRKSAASLAGRSRRGTVLLLVLGALALVLILSVVYAALGKGDRRTAGSVVERLDAQENVEGIGNHILDTLALDVFSLVPDVAMGEALALMGETDPIMRREVTDMPYTDFFHISVPSALLGFDADATPGPDQGVLDALRFRPYGSHSADAIWDVDFVSADDLADITDIDIDPRVASDPFLASTRPVDLGYRDFDDDYNPFENRRDWLQISNFAPDGTYKNLYYLRADVDGGGFDVPSLDLTRDPDNENERLSLMDRNGDPTEYLPFSDILSSGGTLGRRVQADWNRPAHWTMYQRNLFRPVNDPDFSAEMIDPGDPEYWAYQYADADGDGMLDSRWIELVDSSDETRPTELLGDSDYRFFAAIRAVDLSSLANVTTATDFLTPPSTSNRLGQGAHEINLFKLFNQTEHHFAHGNGFPLGYQQAFLTGTGTQGDYGAYDIEAAQQLGRKAYLRMMDGAVAGWIQRYGAVPGEENRNAVLSDNLDDYTIFDNVEERAVYASNVGSVYPGISSGGNNRVAPYGIDDLVELLTFHGINDDQNFSLLEKALTSSNENDPLSLSMLRSDSSTELDAWPSQDLQDDYSGTGNYAIDDGTRAKLARSAVDVRRLLTTVSGHRPLRSSILDAAEYGNLTENTDRKRWLNGLVLDDGNYLNDDDGNSIDEYREEQYALVHNAFGLYMDLLAPNLNQEDWNRLDQQRFDNTRTQYYGHLGPELAVRLAGHMALNFRDMADTPIIDLLNGTNPGPNGVPDVENILNLDLNDQNTLAAYQRREDTPTAAVLRLSDNWMPTLGAGASDLMDQMWEAGMKLDIEQLYEGEGYDFNDPQHIAFNGLDNVSHDAMILYGVEPQPFISQVSSFSMYVDVQKDFMDQLNGGGNPDGEWDPSAINAGNGPDNLPDNADDWDGLPNINGEIDAANEDFIFQSLLFQIFNPFDTPIPLNRYYFEYGDSFYGFDDGVSAVEVIAPRSTLILWVTNPFDPAEIEARLTNAGITVPLVDPRIADSAIEMMIKRQIGVGSDVGVVPIRKRYSNNGGGLVGSGSVNEVSPTDVIDLFHLDTSANSDANRVVMLWRDNPSIDDPSLGLFDWTQTSISQADRATDQLVDRLRDNSDYEVTSGLVGSGAPSRAALDRRLSLPTRDGPNGEVTVNYAVAGSPGHRGSPDFLTFPDAVNYNNTPLGVLLWGNVSRKDDSEYQSGTSAVGYYDGNAPGGVPAGAPGDYDVVGTPVGALPAKIFEPTFQLPGGAYSITGVSPFLEHEIDVAGNGSRMLPEDLVLEDDFAVYNVPDSTNMAHENANTLWGQLQTGLVRTRVSASLGTSALVRDAGIDLAAPIGTSFLTDVGEYSGRSYISARFNQNEFRDILTGRQTIRVGDMLLPLAVGAYRTPLETGPNTEPNSPDGVYSDNVALRLGQYEAQWTTIGEVLAAAHGYSDSVGPSTSRSISGGLDDPFRDLSFWLDPTLGVRAPNQEGYVLDRGHLRLDAFASYIDLGDGSTDTPNGEFDVETDVRRGLGIPMVLELFDMAQAGSELGFAAMGSIDRPVMGTVNTNTADPQILRLSPVLSKDVHNTAGVTDFDRLWWPEFTRNVTENDTAYQVNAFVTRQLGTGGAPAQVYSADVGSTIADYRDAARYSRHNPGDLGGFGTPLAMEEVADTVVDYVDPNEEELGLLIDRTVNSGMEIIRTEPGIGSMGELLGARNVDPNNVDNQHHMDGFARDNRTDGVAFIDRRAPNNNDNYGRGMAEPRDPQDFVRNNTLSMDIASFGGHLHGDLIGASYARRLLDGTLQPADLEQVFPGYLDSSGAPLNSLLPLMPDQVPDDYGEQLTQLNAVLNSMSVGSDYYAVWYLVHGYKEGDTLGLSEQDPLTPSFKARYLMIVDRSNVTEKGDRPKVLAFVQVPTELPGITPGG
ncbi:MAG: hypothetical protein ED559_08000 [Phycisphaera sp.]|nr:MAG: hypothetical protein ED559_08000 [Phycisphaera sp.]